MSFSGFGKASGPSLPPATETTFENAPAFPWRPPNINPNTPNAFALFPNVQQPQQVNPTQTQRPDSSFNTLARQRMSPPHSDPLSQNMLEHDESQSDGKQSIVTLIPSKPAYLAAPKRPRSPLISVENPSNSSSAFPDSEREMQAKAKRLARFHSELSQPLHNLHDIHRHKTSANRQNQLPLVQQRADEHTEDTTYEGSFPDQESAESLKAVVGLCPDMCPELERDERERKGDLDKYERMNGDRNQTSIFLAVKKYNRMAEREAELIRPMPVLQKTVDYLLSLLDQPYDGNFLNIYNFLWDRMRAVRMDLRMQHIFNEDAILMLEQMIRLHVIAMHELCEFKKGEGFTEGFDAHLNIEQMNKTSVELFHLYDDHRKRGKYFASEKEFRGYYALFKLDKHPGYKVEPSELSLDLAKMTSEIRSTPEILFARDVARACRIGNYIGFFRLARKATYLQACLMHAHFSKLRKQALASLHSGLQNNQGIPLVQVETWLAMEGEDVEGLLEYHGFSIKKYEEAYMVKEGSFLSDMDFPTRCSQLVHHKRSKRVVDDARSVLVIEQHSGERECTINNVDLDNHRYSISSITLPTAYDELMPDSGVSPTSMVLAEQSLPKEKVPIIQNRESGMKMVEFSAMVTPFLPPAEDVGEFIHRDDSQQILQHYNDASFNATPMQVFENKKSQQAIDQNSSFCMTYENSTPQKCEDEKLESETLLPLFDQKEAKRGMLKLILRKWKKKSAMKRGNREHKKLLVKAALSSLSVGLPIGHIISQTRSFENLDVDAIARARLEKYRMSWSRLNISDLVAPIMFARNPDASFICFKLVLLVQPSDPAYQTHQLALDWLFLKLMGASKEHDDELMLSSSCLSIWKKWTDRCGNSPQTCCLSVIRKKVLDDAQKFDERDAVDGASCLVYLVSETIPWETQRARLRNFCVSIPDGSNLPLLLLSIDSPRGQIEERSLDIIRRLSFHDEDKRRICSSFVTFLDDSRFENIHSFFDDHQLRVGLQWLANNTPSVPLLCPVRTRELVLNYLRRYMAANHQGLDMTPDDCIAGFNEALDKSAEEIMVAASSNPIQWPAPEIYLLDKSSNEGILASMCFPSTGWSLPTRIDPLVRAIKSCKLPNFPDTSWLKHEPLMGEQIKQQKLALENLMIRYLNESNKLLKGDLVSQEVSVMLQKGVDLQLHGSGCCLFPRWSFIFKRIYSWQLNKLVVPVISNAYILDNKDHLADNPILDSDLAQVNHSYTSTDLPRSSCLEESLSFHSFPAEVSLDELVEISCCNPLEKRPLVSWALPLRTISEVSDVVQANDDSGYGIDVEMTSQNHEDLRCSSSDELIPELMNANRQITTISKSSRLNMLLERCNKLQDMIDQKLAIYF